MEISVLQAAIQRIDGVLNVRVINENDEIKEIHILSNHLRAPKQIVRDIESSLIAEYDYRIDRKIISIAQIKNDDIKEVKRIKLEGISMNTVGNFAECTVTLKYEGEEYTEIQSGIKTISGKRKIVALATIKAVEKILGQASLFDIQDVIVNNNKDSTVVSVLVNMIEDEKEEILVGATIVHSDVNEAISKAALDAVNRRIQIINF